MAKVIGREQCKPGFDNVISAGNMAVSVPYVVLSEYEPSLKRRLEKRLQPYEFKFCGEKEWEELRNFIKTYWGADHIYVTSPELIHWQQYDQAKRRYNFVIAKNKQDREIYGCIAFIFTSQFDPAVSIRDLWVGLWRSRPDAAPGLGGEVLRFLINSTRPRSLGCLGLSKNTITSIPRLGLTVGTMEHHYLLNPDVKEFRLVRRAESTPRIEDISSRGGPTLLELAPEQVLNFVIEDFIPAHFTPMKTMAYAYNRFSRHPFRKYRTFAVRTDGHNLGLLVTRTVSALGASAMQIVDYIGHDRGWVGLGLALLQLIRDSGAEFIDLYSHGIGKAELEASGMIPHRADDPLIIPLYFEPFKQRNVGLDYGYLVPEGANYRVFKADSDQDRPNRLPATEGTGFAQTRNVMPATEHG